MATLLEKHLKLEEMKKIRNWRNEGYELEKIKELVDKTNITDEEIEQIFYENSEEIQEQNLNEEISNTSEANEDNKEVEPQEEIKTEIIEEPKEQIETEEIYNDENISEEFDEDDMDDLEEIEENEIEIEEENIIDDVKSENVEDEKYEIIKDEDLEDFPNQPFKMYSESRKNTMIESIKINGIIEPIVVRKTENGKYQILSGHNRRLCGREAGLTEFRCIVKENMTEDEARLYMVDSNLMVRDVMPTERGKALSIRKECLRNEKIASKIENENSIVSLKGNWQIDVDVPEKMYNRQSISYKVIKSDNNDFEVTNATLYDTGFEFGMIVSNIKEPDVPKLLIDKGIFKVNEEGKAYLIYNEDTEKLLREDIDVKEAFNKYRARPIEAYRSPTNDSFETITYVENEEGQKFESTMSPSRRAEGNYIDGNKYSFYETFSLTKSNATDKLKVKVLYNNVQYIIELEKVEN